MAIEIEKKYRLTAQQRELVVRRLRQIGAKLQGQGFEENTLYGGRGLAIGLSVLRLRREDGSATLTYKRLLSPSSSIKRQREDETVVTDPDALNDILEGLGYRPALVYEKRRETWLLGKTVIVIDELPFGLFMEIEGNEAEIAATELKIGIKGLRVERSTYPQLTREHGKRNGKLIEARFSRHQGKR